MSGLATVTVTMVVVVWRIMVLIVIMRIMMIMPRHLPLTGFVDPKKDDYVGITIQTTYFPGMFRTKRYCRDILVPTPLSRGMRHLAEAVIS